MRLARDEVELGGAVIPKGSPIAAVLASANHDEERFTDPHFFNIHREQGPHASFGFGQHFCAGKWFATKQIEIALGVLLERLKDIRLNPDRLPEFRGWEFRAPTSLHVKYQ
jgi:cytochrome P450